MDIKRIIIVTVMITVMIAALTVPATGQPDVCGFYGTVTLNGNPVTENTVIMAWIDGSIVESTMTFSHEDDSVYFTIVL